MLGRFRRVISLVLDMLSGVLSFILPGHKDHES